MTQDVQTPKAAAPQVESPANLGGQRFDMLMPPEMAELAANAGLRKVQMDFLSMMLLGILAGIFIGLASSFYTVTVTGGSAMPFGVTRLLGGLAFCLGLVLVVIAGAELFTGNTLIVMAVASGKVGLRWLLRDWVIVFAGNLIGSLGIAWIIVQAGQHELGGGAVGTTAMEIAGSKTDMTFAQAFWRGVVCNALVCLAIWLCYSARSTTDRVLAIVFPITAFVACGFEHCVANMYFIPFALLAEPAIAAQPAASLTWGGFWINILAVTLGNLVGGAGLVGMLLWVIYCRRTPKYRKMMK